jgi:hypothetical protein
MLGVKSMIPDYAASYFERHWPWENQISLYHPFSSKLSGIVYLYRYYEINHRMSKKELWRYIFKFL